MRAKDGHVALEMDKSEISRHSFVDGISVHWEIAHRKVYIVNCEVTKLQQISCMLQLPRNSQFVNQSS